MWRQGEHVALIGQTGSGKTTLARELLRQRGYVIILITKPDVDMWPGSWQRITSVSQIKLSDATHWILRPTYEQQQLEVSRALMTAWEQGGWTVYVDELYYVQDQLKLQDAVIQLLTQGRSNHITMVTGMQRPAWVTRYALSEPTHIYCARLGDERDAQTVKSIIGSQFLDAVKAVPWHKFIHLNKITGELETVDKNTIGKALTKER